MAFETKGQEIFSQITAALVWLTIYGIGFIVVMYAVDACGPEPKNRCVCECNGKAN